MVFNFDLPFHDAASKAAEPAPERTDPYSVSEVTAMVKSALELSLPHRLLVAGEISNFKAHSSGHVYLTLKDGRSELSCVMWRSQAGKLKFRPDDGMEVVATGRVDVYERSGRYQLYVQRLEPRGIGALELAFRQLVEKLRDEGLFDPSRKVAIPPFPRRIAIVTSPTGAAIADMVRTLRRRFPAIEVFIVPARVQGDGAAAEIAEAVRLVNRQSESLGGVDTLIVARGGGSLEDLWAFNEEVVARAIASSAIPVISGVGHETDVTVSDMVADVRAATPTAAAELAVPVLADLLDRLAQLSMILRRTVVRDHARGEERLTALLRRRALGDPYFPVRQREQAVDESSYRMHRAVEGIMRRSRLRLETGRGTMQRHAPHVKLSRAGTALSDAAYRMGRAWERTITDRSRRLQEALRSVEMNSPVHAVRAARASLRQIIYLMNVGIRHRLTNDGTALQHAGERLAALGHESVLKRGYSITRVKGAGGRILRSSGEVQDGDKILTQLAEGEVHSVVVNQRQLELFDKDKQAGSKGHGEKESDV